VSSVLLKIPGIDVREKAPLRDFTSFRLGGPCRRLITCETPRQLEIVVGELAAADEKFELIGGGSNLLVADNGLDTAVVRYYTEKPTIRRHGNILEVDCGMLLDDLALFTVEQGLDGLVYASGIPGTVGGAIAGNAGAFGKQIGDWTVSVLLMDHTGGKRWENGKNLGFAYRGSRLQAGREIAMTAVLKLEAGEPAELGKQRDENLDLRRRKHPDWRKQPTAGSFFRNIEPTSSAERRQAAGWFLEQAGAKNMRVGGARVFEKHANIIVAEDGCTARDVLELSRRMAAVVKAKFRFELVPEVRAIGLFAP
jgi:UDP-N-acetylmuramate dehydrogenase